MKGKLIYIQNRYGKLNTHKADFTEISDRHTNCWILKKISDYNSDKYNYIRNQLGIVK